MVVKLVNCQALVLLILSVQTFFVNAGNFAPVLLWTSESLNLANPFERTTKVEFENVLNKNLGKERPPVLVFVKNNFCIEDITLNKKNFQVLSKAGPVSYFSAVESPVTAFSDLSSYQVHTSNDLHDFVEGQIYLIDINDISEIPNSEFIQVTRSKNLIVAVTGKSCKLFSPKRSKREVGVETTESSKNLTVKNADVLLYAEEYPMIKVNTDPFKRLGNMINSRFNKTGGKLEIDFDAGENGLQKLTLTFDFKDSAGYYKLDTISVPLTANEKDKAILKVKDVYFPMNSSYHCSRNNVFSNYKKDSPVLLSIKNLQIQIGHEGKFSDDVYSCVGFTSIPIWTGIFVTAILVLILMWGLTMIMDIRTMDRFDDPKGKTIAISAQD